MRITWAAVCAAGAVMVLAGCSSAQHSQAAGVTPVSSSSSSPAVSSSSAPAALTVAQAAAAYTGAVAPLNATIAPLNAAATAVPFDLARAKRAAGNAATANRAFSAGLLATRWPAAVQPTIDQLVQALAQDQVSLSAMANAATENAWSAALTAYNTDSLHAAGLAELVREKLGLSVAPTNP